MTASKENSIHSKESNTSNMPTTERIKFIVSNITVEPILFFTIFSSMIYQLITQNLYMEKACRVSLQFNTSICDAMSDRNQDGYSLSDEAEVQKVSSQMVAIKSAIQGFFPVCLSLFVGSWSDRHNKRKPVILSPVIGEFLCCICLILNTIFFYQLPIIFTALSDALPLALLGGWQCLFLGAFSFVASISSKENKTVRMGALTTTQTASRLLGIGVSGVLFQLFGFIATYTVCAVMISIAIAYTYFFIKDVDLKKNIVDDVNTVQTRTEKPFLRDFFDLKYVLSTFRVCFKRGKRNRRLRMVAILLCAMVVTGPSHGEATVTYMYTRIKFGWSALEFSAYSLLHFLTQFCANIISMAVFSKCFQWEDATLGIIAMVSSLAGCVLYAFVPRGEYFFAVNVVESFYNSSHIALRTLMAKLVQPHELGQANSVYGLCEALTPLLFGPFYTMLYKNTVDIFPGMFYLLSAMFKVIGIFLFGLLYVQTVKHKREKHTEVRTDSDDISVKESEGSF